jgi:hypothetical protein
VKGFNVEQLRAEKATKATTSNERIVRFITTSIDVPWLVVGDSSKQPTPQVIY